MTHAPAPTSTPPVDPVQERRVLTAGVVGSVVEWYDFGLYSAASALVIGPLFFSSDLSPAAATLASFATFAIGFFARPVGGLLIANFGDRVGRKPALVFTLFLMGGSTFLMGCVPTYDQIGLWAPVLLVSLRLLQGAGAGAELAGTMTMVSETIRPSRLAFGTAVPNGATAVGAALGIVTFLVVSLLPEEQFFGWGWRLPFWFSAVIFLVAVYIRHRIEETPEFLQVKREVAATTAPKVPLLSLVRRYPVEVLLGFGAMAGHQAMSYITTTFALSYLTETLSVERSVALTASLTASLVGAALACAFGAAADRVGIPKVFVFGATWCLLMAFPFFLLIDTAVPLLIVAGLVLTYSISFGAMAGAQGAFLVNLFPADVRYSGVAISRELAGTLIGGPAPFVAAGLVALSGGSPWLVAVFLSAVCGASIVCLTVARRRMTSTPRTGTVPATPEGADR